MRASLHFFNSFFTRRFGCTGLLLIIIGIGLVGSGCRVSAPVSSIHEKETKRDSVTSSIATRKDSTIHKETITKKILPAATVGITLTQKQMDSLITALGNLPSGIPVTVTDPDMRAQIKLVLDANKQLHIECTSTAQKYFEMHTEDVHVIEDQKATIDRLTKELIDKTEVVKEKQLTWFGRVWKFIKEFTGMVVLTAFVLIGIAIYLFEKFKKLRLR